MSKPIELTDENLEETLSNSSVPVLVDYWAEWCGPCKMVAPVLEELAVELEGKLTVGKVDVDSNRDAAAKQNVMSIPTLILFKDGQPIDQRIGALTKNQLQEFINEHISHSLGKSLIEIQELNFYKDGEATPFGDVVGSEAFNWTVPLLWEQVKESVDYYARKASVELFNKSNRYRKRGVCMVPTKYGIGVSSAENRLQVLHHILQLPRRPLYAHKTLLRELWFDQPSRRNTPSVR